MEIEELLVWLPGLARHRALRQVVAREGHEVVVHGNLTEAIGGERRTVFLLLKHRVGDDPSRPQLASANPARLDPGIDHALNVWTPVTSGLHAGMPWKRPDRMVLREPKRRETRRLDLDEIALETVRGRPQHLAILAGVGQHLVVLIHALDGLG